MLKTIGVIKFAHSDPFYQTSLIHYIRDMLDPRIEEAIILMRHFTERTGLTSSQPPRRYLWTDAFAVCNDLGLARFTGEHRYLERALQLVDQVHHILGKHRDDDPRSGWISGLDEQAGEHHPTLGGLRIGKALAERSVEEAIDERLEWDRDGQYFHYLTKWMHALDQLARVSQQPHYNTWARELAQTAFNAFTYITKRSTQPRRMVWKMSIDLSRAQVAAMGQHDPLDGYITTLQLRATATALAESTSGPSLDDEIRAYTVMIKDGDWTTTDPLGLGGLLSDAYRLYQLMQQGVPVDEVLLDNLLSSALSGLRYYARSGELRQPAQYRLAFRELGLAIGLHAVERMQNTSQRDLLNALREYLSLCGEIEIFWRDPKHQESTSWTEHQDINQVMLATALAPDGFLELFLPE